MTTTQESGDETNTSIPAVAHQVSTKATFAAPAKKRNRGMIMDSDDDDKSDFFHNQNEGERDDFSNVSSTHH